MGHSRNRKHLCVIISGPTGAGKSAIACIIAEKLSGEIINADSRQFFSEISIGTAKPSPEIIDRIPHHLIGFLSIKDDFTVFDFRERVEAIIPGIWQRGNVPLITGGSGFYIRSLVKGIFDLPESSKNRLKEIRLSLESKTTDELYRQLALIDPCITVKLHANDRVRIRRALEIWHATGRPMSCWQAEARPARFLKECELFHFVVCPARSKLYQRIDARTEEMFAAGWVNEVRGLLNQGLGEYLRARAPIGYPEIADYLELGGRYQQLVEDVKRKTRNYAKRQISWFRKEEKCIWLSPQDETPEMIAHIILEYLREAYFATAG